MERKDRVLDPALLEQQMEYARRVRQIFESRGRQPLACTHTFGCQQNEADTELIRGLLAEMGYGFTEEEDRADLILLNTCAIRDHAEKKVFGNLGELSHRKEHNPDLITCLCGCMAQQERVMEKVKKSYPYIDIVFGTHALYRLPQMLLKKLQTGKRVFDIQGEEQGVILEGVTPIRKPGVRAWLSIMYGCNNFCSYCIVPHVRGRERSRRPEVILQEFEKLVAQGYRDITLLGQNVNSYGKDLDCGWDFPRLLRAINELPGDFRVRFMTSHPKDATPALFDAMAECDKVCKAIHLPVQAGSDRVLSEMNRRYTAEHYMSLVNYAKAKMPELCMTSDIIVGFPGETTPEFEETLSLLEQVRFDSLFTIIYSPRPGTRAAELPDPMTRAEKQVNFDRLLETQNRISRERNDACLDRVFTVLVDGESEDPRYNLSARTDGFKLVYLQGDKSLIGQYVDVRIVRSTTWLLFGEAVN